VLRLLTLCNQYLFSEERVAETGGSRNALPLFHYKYTAMEEFNGSIYNNKHH
jgi:hypothetical protein